MKLLTCFTSFALVGLLAAASNSNDVKVQKLVIPPEYYMKELIKYTAKHDIVNLVVARNSINLADNPIDDFILFFVEADVQPDGSRVDQGLYVLKDGKATKLLENGRDATASALDHSKKAFFGAKDDIYVYNLKTNSAEKYGTITDSIISIDMEKVDEVIYILTEDRELYKVTENGEKKEKLEDVVKPEQIIVDNENNLFFFSDDQVPYVRTADGVKKIEGLPEAKGPTTLFEPPLSLDHGTTIIIAYEAYFMYPNGTSESANFGFRPNALPTALAPEATDVQYYAYDKKIYEYNVVTLVFTKSLVEYLAEITGFGRKSNVKGIA